MVTRKIVKIDEDKCNGCGMCIPNCAEGAIQLINGKAKLADDKFCDGLGACLGHCPQDAITITERDAEEFNEEAVKIHLKGHDQGIRHDQRKHHTQNMHQMAHQIPHHQPFSCPGSREMDFRDKKQPDIKPDIRTGTASQSLALASELRQWPVQLTLVSPTASYFKDADLLVAADCVPFAYPDFHRDFLAKKALVIGCPKLDDVQFYIDKLTQILKSSNIKSITLVNMEVPCCFGLQHIVEESIKRAGKNIPVNQSVISIRGEKLNF